MSEVSMKELRERMIKVTGHCQGLECFDLISFLERQKRFSLKTFGDQPRTQGVIDHIKKELIEVESNPDDVMEWVDIILLAFDGALRRGFTSYSVVNALHEKLHINENRKWPDWKTLPDNVAIEHDRVQEG